MLIGRLLVATLVAVAAAPAAAEAASLRITKPTASRPVYAHRVLADAAVTLDVRGRGRPGAVIALETPCVRTPCVTTTVASRRGRWRTPLRVVVPGDQRSIVLTARSGARSTGVGVGVSVPPRANAATRGAPYFAMVGDSLAEGTRFALPRLLPDYEVSTDYRRGRPLSEGMGVFDASRIPDRRHVVAFSLFTNDDPRHDGQLERSVRATVDRVGVNGCAVWATISRPRVRGTSYGAANTLLKRLDVQYGDRLEVVDWAREIRRHPKLMGPDGVHPTPDGYGRRAELYAAAGKRCLGARMRSMASARKRSSRTARRRRGWSRRERVRAMARTRSRSARSDAQR